MARRTTIRKAVDKDVPAIVELWKEMIDFHKERDRFFSRSATGHKAFAEFLTGNISSETACVFVAEVGKDIVGYCLAVVEKYPPLLEIQEYGLIRNMAITRRYRRKGIGRRLLEEIQSWCSGKGVQRIETRFSTSNELSAAFWAKMGFTPYLETVFLELPGGDSEG
jgi:GNAT superfamily N-acetyltransferase